MVSALLLPLLGFVLYEECSVSQSLVFFPVFILPWFLCLVAMAEDLFGETLEEQSGEAFSFYASKLPLSQSLESELSV